jgi:Pyridoxamine 5'-phosphate oxidase
MKAEILEYISNQRVCVVALEMPDGSPHAATVHYAHIGDPFTIIIQTSPKSRKYEPLLAHKSVRASVVIGLAEVAGGKEKTFQLDGDAQVLDKNNLLVKTYLDKFPEKIGKWSEDIFLTVTPKWWRFTDWSKSEGKTVFNSDGTISVRAKIAS